MKNSKKGILVIGSMNVDMVVKTQHIPKPGETLLGGVFNQFNGGKGANQAVAAKKLFAETKFCAGVGDDAFGKEYLAYFKKNKIDTSLVKVFKGAHTGIAVIMVGEDAENSIAVAPGANMLIKPSHMKAINFAKFSTVVMQLETPMETVAEALKLARKAGCKTVLTPAPAQLLPAKILPHIDYLVPNEHEILLLQKGFSKPLEAAKNLIKYGVGNVIITLGSKGAMLINSDAQIEYPAYKVKPVDTVGAGDCFAGSFAAGLMLYDNPDKAMKLASAAAALAVTKMGAQSYHSLDEVKKFARLQ